MDFYTFILIERNNKMNELHFINFFMKENNFFLFLIEFVFYLLFNIFFI